MDRILIILKKRKWPKGLNTIIFKYVYWYMKQISGLDLDLDLDLDKYVAGPFSI